VRLQWCQLFNAVSLPIDVIASVKGHCDTRCWRRAKSQNRCQLSEVSGKPGAYVAISAGGAPGPLYFLDRKGRHCKRAFFSASVVSFPGHHRCCIHRARIKGLPFLALWTPAIARFFFNRSWDADTRFVFADYIPRRCNGNRHGLLLPSKSSR
jgi:hypothetical protein